MHIIDVSQRSVAEEASYACNLPVHLYLGQMADSWPDPGTVSALEYSINPNNVLARQKATNHLETVWAERPGLRHFNIRRYVSSMLM